MPLTPFRHETASIAHALNRSATIYLNGLQGSAAALLLSRLSHLENSGCIILSDDFQKSQDLCRDVAAYLEMLPAPELQPELLTLPPLPRLAYRQTLRSGRIERERIKTLARIRHLKNFLCFTTITAYADRLPAPESFHQHFLRLEWGQTIDRDQLFANLEKFGYVRVPVVDEPGDYSVRGGVIDIFSTLHDEPIRLDFFGDEIESIRPFDHLTQLSKKLEYEFMELGPAREVLPPADLDAARQRVRQRFVELNDSHIALGPALEELGQSPNRPGFETWLPAFAPQWHSLADFFPDDSVVIFMAPQELKEQLEDLQQQLDEGYARALAEQRLTYPPSAYLMPAERALEAPAGQSAIYIDELSDTALFPGIMLPKSNPTQTLNPSDGAAEERPILTLTCKTRDNLFLKNSVALAAGGSGENPLQAAAMLLKEHLNQGYRIVLAGRNQTTCERLGSLLLDYGLPVYSPQGTNDCPADRLCLLSLRLSQGVQLPEEKLLFLSDTDLFGAKQKSRAETSRRQEGRESFFDDFAEIKPGDLITHIEHGIGCYQGLKTLTVEGIVNEYLILEYQGADLLYVPVDSFDQLHKYHGSGDSSATLSRLGGPQWAAAKEKTRKAIDDLLLELLDLYAEREVMEGRACFPPDHLFREFEASFAYEETPDQLRAINEVINDLTSAKPMDRLISGDVGFGKTEVALRAVFLTVLSGRQAGVMVPTTVLAQQHYETFKERFANYPVSVAVLSRFCTPAQQKQVAAGLRAGTIDVVIGTHRLLQKDISFKNLGLLVLDEEHKFGVRHKEKLKNFRRHLDVISMSATPIPRTLQFSLSGMRSLSAITTAPRDRLAIRTFVAAYDDLIIKEAVSKELDRGGQIFFVHNSVATIHARAARLKALLPDLRIAIGHGQMPEHELEEVMLGFAGHSYDLLLCTTIIESGLDIPNANTIIVENAQNFGLAQLYQMRGRVGRSQRKAYAYLMVPELERLTPEAHKRLNALAEANTLGAGFRIAMQDLEIRGAGNILGKKQSGQISAIGYELYQEMLSEAINEARGNHQIKIPEPEVKVSLSAHIPSGYLPDLTLRLQFYKKIAECENEAELARLEDELTDRCGPPPEEVLNLLRLKSLKILLKSYRVLALELGRKKISLHFDPENPPATEKLMALIQENAHLCKLTPDYWFSQTLALEPQELYAWCEKLLQKIN
ncbi:MAG: transcription-repair coupling factor [Deltaproteobacteria bacterium]|nr:transcription-repair coupling factor [Deltaproteobacteria bacterium]